MVGPQDAPGAPGAPALHGTQPHRAAVHAAWDDYGDPRRIVSLDEVSANVSTNRVYRVHLDDGSTLVSKVSSYGSYFLFVEDHERLRLCASLLDTTRFAGMLADVWTARPDHLAPGERNHIYTWYDRTMWAVFYDDVPRGESLPRVLSEDMIRNLGREMAEFHLACTDLAPRIPGGSKTIKSDAIHLLDLLESPFAPRNFDLQPEAIGLLWRHTHDFLERLVALGYDEWTKIPVLIDWNLGNFSVKPGPTGFRLFSRWDYDWFRIEPRMLDFYFLSRVSSSTGDRTRFSYGAHTLLEPSFLAFIDAYTDVFPMSREELEFLPEVYRFFILNYVVREGARFFRSDLCATFRRDAVRTYLPTFERTDFSALAHAAR
jgi:Ser/Thr protein kinase RdoA (MazF antagonist)